MINPCHFCKKLKTNNKNLKIWFESQFKSRWLQSQVKYLIKHETNTFTLTKVIICPYGLWKITGTICIY